MLANLWKVFWPQLGLTKHDLLQYYADLSEWLLPYLIEDRGSLVAFIEAIGEQTPRRRPSAA